MMRDPLWMEGDDIAVGDDILDEIDDEVDGDLIDFDWFDSEPDPDKLHDGFYDD